MKPVEQSLAELKPRQLWQRWRSRLIKFTAGYCLICLTLYFQQQRLMFYPTKQLAHTPAAYDLHYQDVWLPIGAEVEQSETLYGWWIPAQEPNAPVILYLHHNAINIGANVSQAAQFHELGYAVFLFDYRGFGQSSGTFPHESQVYQDAQVAWDYLTQDQKIAPGQIVIYGHSIGGAIAVELATQQPEAAALIVHNTFTSMRDMTKRFGV
ncbi:MAG: alpha/beta fold hydrolase [Cyanobacteria bacterium P01_H01_bin.121]